LSWPFFTDTASWVTTEHRLYANAAERFMRHALVPNIEKWCEQGVATHAKRDGDSYVVNGSKTFITNGQTAELICVVVKTDLSAGAKGTSLIFVETQHGQGFHRGRNLKKLGMKGNDTSELFFEDVRVPSENLLGEVEGQGFYQLMN
jgi:acyl-CoA dehydrogenase